MSRIDSAINIDDLKRMAKRRLPRIMFDFIEGGVEDEVGLRTNANAFRDLRLVPRYYVDTSKREQRAALFGRSYASPFGIAPTGMAGAFRRDAELYVLDGSAERGEKNRFVVVEVFTCMIRARRLGKADLPARIPDHENDGDGILEIRLLDRRKPLGMIDQALRLPQKNGHDFSAANGIIDDDKIPALHVRARRRPAPGVDDAREDLSRDCLPRLEPAHTAPPPHHLLKRHLPGPRLRPGHGRLPLSPAP